MTVIEGVWITTGRRGGIGSGIGPGCLEIRLDGATVAHGPTLGDTIREASKALGPDSGTGNTKLEKAGNAFRRYLTAPATEPKRSNNETTRQQRTGGVSGRTAAWAPVQPSELLRSCAAENVCPRKFEPLAGPQLEIGAPARETGCERCSRSSVCSLLDKSLFRT